MNNIFRNTNQQKRARIPYAPVYTVFKLPPVCCRLAKLIGYKGMRPAFFERAFR